MEIRCFIAVSLTDEIKDSISRKTTRLRKLDADVRWVPVENLHLTIKFLGNTPEESIPGITDRIERIASANGGFTFGLSGTGVFPDPKRPRVVWIGIKETGGRIIKLKQEVEGAMAELGFEPEARTFKPHLTLGRVKSPRGKLALLKELDRLKDEEFGTVEVKGITLYRSDLGPGVARHTVLQHAALGPRAS